MPGCDPLQVSAQIDVADDTECRAALHLLAGHLPLDVAVALGRVRRAHDEAAVASSPREGPVAEIQELAELAYRISCCPVELPDELPVTRANLRRVVTHPSTLGNEPLEELRIKVYKPAKRKRWLRSPVISPFSGGRAELAVVISAAKARLIATQRATNFDEHDLAAAAQYEDS